MQTNVSESILNNELIINEWMNFIRPDYVCRKTVESFSTVLSRYFEDCENRYNITQKDIAKISGVGSSMITKYRKGDRKPNLISLIMICIALRLTPDRSHYLLYTAGYTLNDSWEHRIYKLFLTGCAFNDKYSIKNCNELITRCINIGYLKEK